MNSTAPSVPVLKTDDDVSLLSSLVCIDHKVARRAPRLQLLALSKTRIEWFYILGVNVERPEELNQSKYRGIKESAVRLPATTESLLKLKRVFDLYPEPCRFDDLEIRYCSGNTDLIIYSIRTAIDKPKVASA